MENEKKEFHCELCNVSVTSQVTLESHLTGAKHLAEVRKKDCRELQEKCGLFVANIPKNVDRVKLIEFFSSFGKIIKHFFEDSNKYLMLTFENQEDVQKLLKERVTFCGQKLVIERQIVKRKEREKIQLQKFDDNTLIKDIKEHILVIPNFEDQLKMILSRFMLSLNEMIMKQRMLCADLHNAFCNIFRNCQVHLFGSTMTGLGFWFSDQDVYVSVPPSPNNPRNSEIKTAKGALYKSRKFSNIIAISNAKTPIVKCVHIPTGVSCDINFKNMLGVCNSKLIHFMMSTDERLRPVMALIKLWAKVYKVRETKNLSNYALVMLFIFYLQQPSVKMLPPVMVLQNPRVTFMQDGWNGGFSHDFSLIPKHNCQLSITQLLQNFFEFYSKFEYAFYVICPFTGYTIPKVCYSNPENLPNDLNHYKTMLVSVPPLRTVSPVCVQEPFEMNHNITSSMATAQALSFQNLCKLSADVCSDCLPGNSRKLLSNLFNINLVENSTGFFKIPIDASVMDFEWDMTLTDEENVKKMRLIWFDKVIAFIVSVLKRIFYFDVTVEHHVTKQRKLNNETNVHNSNVVDLFQFNCIGKYDVWTSRKNAKNVAFSETEPLLEREGNISENIIDLQTKIKDETPITEFNLIYAAKINPTEVEFTVNEVKSTTNFYKLTQFLEKNVPIWFTRYMRQENEIKKNVIQTDDNK